MAASGRYFLGDYSKAVTDTCIWKRRRHNQKT
uniref:Uncharacterized protein n=1 Tax=Arundo donax TaxID=35708 RepID=A0A0A9AFW3_ARUDO